jgi:hypothetical protein
MPTLALAGEALVLLLLIPVPPSFILDLENWLLGSLYRSLLCGLGRNKVIQRIHLNFEN